MEDSSSNAGVAAIIGLDENQQLTCQLIGQQAADDNPALETSETPPAAPVTKSNRRRVVKAVVDGNQLEIFEFRED
jgi:hypothetical protein